MMFSLFLVKKVLKNKFNFIPVLLLLLLIPVTLYMNQKTENETGLASWTKEKIEFRTDEIKKLKKHLTTLNEEDEAYIGTKGIIDIYEKQLELDIQALDAINSANWKVANKNLALVAYQDYELSKNSPTMSVQDLNASLGEAMVFDKLAELNL
ncbi:MAG: hypothetical protein LBV67_11320, partial [Streptococcaceae bacterium]|nr:hypothetical protein [Streptococcaceae bacterium]